MLLRSIIGLQTPDEGEIEVLGENMIGRDEDEAKNIRRRWGILFQNGALFSTLTVAENVEVPIREYFPSSEAAAARRNRLATRSRWAAFRADAGPKFPSELSGGMVKRAGLARALALDPGTAVSRRAHRRPRPDRGRRVRRTHQVAPETARPDRLPHHPRPRHAARDLRPDRGACGQEGGGGRDDPGTIGFGSSLDTRIFQWTAGASCGRQL